MALGAFRSVGRMGCGVCRPDPAASPEQGHRLPRPGVLSFHKSTEIAPRPCARLIQSPIGRPSAKQAARLSSTRFDRSSLRDDAIRPYTFAGSVSHAVWAASSRDLLERLMAHMSQEKLLEQLDRLCINLTRCEGG